MSQHHGRKTLVVDEHIDRWGQLRPVKGLGFRHVSIWDEMDARKSGPKFQRIWIENHERKVVFEARRHHTYEQVVSFRNEAFPNGTVCCWEGEDDGAFVAVDRPATARKRGKKR
jgi:hypothetical protein